MAYFPFSEYNPRTLTNVPRHTFDEDKTDTVFAEDINALNTEVKEIEDTLLNVDDKKIPFGVTVGNEDTSLKIEGAEIAGLDIPRFRAPIIPELGLEVMEMPQIHFQRVPEESFAGFAWLDPDGVILAQLFYDSELNFILYTGGFAVDGYVATGSGFTVDGYEGQDNYTEFVVALRIHDAVLQMKKQGFVTRGGIMTRVDEPWEWTNVPTTSSWF